MSPTICGHMPEATRGCGVARATSGLSKERPTGAKETYSRKIAATEGCIPEIFFERHASLLDEGWVEIASAHFFRWHLSGKLWESFRRFGGGGRERERGGRGEGRKGRGEEPERSVTQKAAEWEGGREGGRETGE